MITLGCGKGEDSQGVHTRISFGGCNPPVPDLLNLAGSPLAALLTRHGDMTLMGAGLGLHPLPPQKKVLLGGWSRGAISGLVKLLCPRVRVRRG